MFSLTLLAFLSVSKPFFLDNHAHKTSTLSLHCHLFRLVGRVFLSQDLSFPASCLALPMILPFQVHVGGIYAAYLHVLGPCWDHVGPRLRFTFRITNTSFAGGSLGCGAICAAQHCGLGGAGGPCNVQYLLRNVDFSKAQNVGRFS